MFRHKIGVFTTHNDGFYCLWFKFRYASALGAHKLCVRVTANRNFKHRFFTTLVLFVQAVNDLRFLQQIDGVIDRVPRYKILRS